MKRIKTIYIDGYEDNKRISEENNVLNYLNPEYVYYSVDKATVLKNVGERVFVGEAIIKKDNSSLIHSSVSGEIISIDEKMFSKNGKLEKHIKIKNDFQEEKSLKYQKNTINNKNDLIKELYQKGIVGLGGGAFPSYKKLKNKNIETLIVNACECELFLSSDSKIISLKHKEIIDCINQLINLLDLKEVFICLKRNKINLINLFDEEIKLKKLNEKIKIFLVEDLYPVGYERYLIQEIKNKKYNKYPIEINTIVFNVSTIFSIYEALEFGKPLIERVITFSGYGLEKTQNIYLKIGTCLNELVNKGIISYSVNTKNAYLISSGPFTGESIHNDNLVLSNSVSGITILPLKEKYEMEACMGCGRCNYYCPSFLTPTEIVFALNNKNIKLLKDLKALNCVSCGLCSYVCPSRIELTNLMKRAKKMLGSERDE